MFSGKVAMALFLSLFIISMAGMAAAASNFGQDFDIMFGDHRAKILDGGTRLTLDQDKSSGAGFKSKNEFLYGRFDMQMKLAQGHSAGLVTTFYLQSIMGTHDEIDFEFLGNSTGNPYTLHTNVYTQGVGNKEQQFHLWFDPAADFHTYSIVWNPKRIIFLVDETPIRVFSNLESAGVHYPTKQPMRIYCSFWNADDWATQGGKVKADWSKAPYTASYRNYNINACVGSSPNCVPQTTNPPENKSSWENLALNRKAQAKLRQVQKKNMVYNYCNDKNKFPNGLPKDCTDASNFNILPSAPKTNSTAQ